MHDCFSLAKAFRDEQNKKHDDREDDNSKDCECPRDAGNAFQDANKIVSTIFEG